MFSDADTLLLIRAMRAHGVTELEIETDGRMLRLVLAPQPVAASGPAAPPRITALSPDIGTFLPRGQDDGMAALTGGDGVAAQEILGYCTRGAVRAAITAPAAGRIADPLPRAGAVLGHGDAVFIVEQS